MVVRSLKSHQPIIWIPPIYTANFRVTVERSDGTIDDITDILLSLKIEDGVTEGIGNFEFEIPNPNETYTSVWTGMEIFRYYSDYAASATTLRFRGRIEKPSNENNNVRCTGRSETLFVQGQNVSKNYETQDVGYIIKDLFDSYGESRFDTSSINTSIGITLTLPFTDYPFWSAVEDVCTAAGYDCYVSAGLVVKFFEQGSQLNTDEGLVDSYNLIEVGDFAPDLTFVKNKIRVIGGVVDGVQVTYTANDTTSQTDRGVRRKTINDDGILTIAAAKEAGDFLLSSEKDEPTVGEVKGLLLATIQPGENIYISSPFENVAPTNYRTIIYKHEIGEQGLYTTVTLNKQPRKISNVLKDRIQREHTTSRVAGNPDDLDFADIELFNSSIGALSNTSIGSGVLYLTAGQTNGTWISTVYNTADSNNVNKVRITLVGDNLPGVTIEVSVNNGVSYDTVTRDNLFTITDIGTSIKLKLTLDGATTQVDSINIQYSTKD